MDHNALFEKIEIWPVKLLMFRKRGIGLWSMGEPDLLLSIQDNLVLFKQARSMSEFLTEHHGCNLSSRRSFQALKRLVASQEVVSIKPTLVYNFARVATLLADYKWEEWSGAVPTYILNTLNMLWDICVTLNKTEFQILMRNNGSHLGELITILTFFDDEERQKISGLDKDGVLNMYKDMIDDVEASVICLS
jgi:hypothetical protein